jgi:hypothetical protein
MWIQATIQLDSRFVRVAAASTPPAFHTLTESLTATNAVKRMLHTSVDIILAVRFIGLRRQGCHGRSTLVSHRLKIQLPRLLVWPQEPPILLFWTRIHAGNLCPPRRSSSGVRMDLLLGSATLFFEPVGRNLKLPFLLSLVGRVRLRLSSDQI